MTPTGPAAIILMSSLMDRAWPHATGETVAPSRWRATLTQAHWSPDARAYLQRRKEAGDTSKEAMRALKRRLSDVVYRALLADASDPTVVTEPLPEAA